MTQFLRSVSFVFVVVMAVLAAPSAVLAQSQPVSVTDQRNTAKTINTINRTAAIAETGFSRLGSNVELLLARLDDSGADDTRLTSVSDFYQHSATATRYRTVARINRDANKQLLRLRAKLNSDSLIEELEEARDQAITQVIAAEGEAIETIQAALDGLVAP